MTTKLMLFAPTGDRTQVGEYTPGSLSNGLCLVCQELRRTRNLQAHILYNHLSLKEHAQYHFEESDNGN